MKNHEHPKRPTIDEIRAARLAGFMASIGHLTPTHRDRLLKNYQKLDARREVVIERFLGSLRKSGD